MCQMYILRNVISNASHVHHTEHATKFTIVVCGRECLFYYQIKPLLLLCKCYVVKKIINGFAVM